jgi:hypothetical protein
MAYVEFGDEEAMKAGLEKRADVSPYDYLCCSSLTMLTRAMQRLNDAVPEVKQATDRETRNAEAQQTGFRGGPFGRGRGGYAARGFAAAGLTRGTPRTNGDGPGHAEAP